MQVVAILVRFQEHPTTKPSEKMNIASIARWSEKHLPVLYLPPNALFEKNKQLWGKGWLPDSKKDQWIQKEGQIICLYNRFPLHHAPQAIERVTHLTQQYAVPFANHPDFQKLVWDKLETGKRLAKAHLPTPAIYQVDQDWEQEKIRTFYLKPRFGAFGQGIRQIQYQNGMVTFKNTHTGKEQTWEIATFKELFRSQQDDHELLVQVAIEPPEKALKGFSIRSLVQRNDDGTWSAHTRVARLSYDDPVANVARGAKAIPLEDFLKTVWKPRKYKEIQDKLTLLDRSVPDALCEVMFNSSHQRVLEMGIDYLLDPQGIPWVLEINGFPQGKLEHLTKQASSRFQATYDQIQQRPLEQLLHWASEGQSKQRI